MHFKIEDDYEERRLGWIGWIYSAIYSRLSQISWAAGNFHSASAELKAQAVQAFAIGTSTLIGVAFNAITGTSRVLPWVLFISTCEDNTHPRGVVAILIFYQSRVEAVVRLIVWLGPVNL